MKHIIAVLILTISTLAQNTTYKDGTDCECDSIVTRYYEEAGTTEEVPYIRDKVHGVLRYYSTSGYAGEVFYENGRVVSAGGVKYIIDETTGAAYLPITSKKYGWDVSKRKVVKASSKQKYLNGLYIVVDSYGDTLRVEKYLNNRKVGIWGEFRGKALFLVDIERDIKDFTLLPTADIPYVDKIERKFDSNGYLVTEIGTFTKDPGQMVEVDYITRNGGLEIKEVRISVVNMPLYYKIYRYDSYALVDYTECAVTRYSDFASYAGFLNIIDIKKINALVSGVCP